MLACDLWLLHRLKTLHMDKSYAGMHGKLPARLLHPLKHLQLLTLTKSGIRSIPANAFHGLRRLQVSTSLPPNLDSKLDNFILIVLK